MRGERDWEVFARMAHRLPQGSLYKAALLHDRELAQAAFDALNGQRLPPPPDPTFEGFDPVVEKLTDVLDVLTALAAGMSGGKARPQKRPQSAFQQIKREYTARGLNMAVAQLVPTEE